MTKKLKNNAKIYLLKGRKNLCSSRFFHLTLILLPFILTFCIPRGSESLSAQTFKKFNRDMEGKTFIAAVVSNFEKDESPKLPVDDIRQFTEEVSQQESSPASLAEEEIDNDASYAEVIDWKSRFYEESSNDLDEYFALFENDPITGSWTKKIQDRIAYSLEKLESDPVSAKESLREITHLILQNEQILAALGKNPQKDVLAKNNRLKIPSLESNGFALASGTGKYGRPMFNKNEEKTEAAASEEVQSELEKYSPAERVELFKTFCYHLDRRLYLWGYAASYFQEIQKGNIDSGHDLTSKEITSLKEKTKAVRNYFGVHEVGKKWRKNFEVDALYNILEKIESEISKNQTFQPIFSQTEETGENRIVSKNEVLQNEMTLLRDILNSIAYKIRSTSMTAEQKKIFEKPLLSAWVQEISKYTCDQTDPYALLALYEKYEKEGGGDTGHELAQTAYRIKTSQSEAGYRLGNSVGMIFNNPNVKIYVSNLFINRFLPIRDPEFDVIQERILGNPVAGSRRTDTQVQIKLVPDSERLLMNLIVTGRVIASTQSDVFPAKIFNESYANYAGAKTIEWKDEGITWSDCRVTVESSNQLSDVKTNIDFVPLVGNLAREVVKGEYKSRQDAILQETKERIQDEVKRRINTETSERLAQVNSRLHQNFFNSLNQMGLKLTMQNSKTTEDWLLASLRLGASSSLGSQTTEPPTLSGAFADLKVHESAINTSLAQLELGGKTFTPQELLTHIAQKLNRPQLADRPIEENKLVLTMAKQDPIFVTFRENKIGLHLRFDSIELGEQYWEMIDVDVNYEPTTDEMGMTWMTRGEHVSVAGPLSIRAQIPLRTIFAKVFPPESRFPLRPKVFDQDERFAGLAVGLCRVTNGWFAVSIIESGVKPEHSKLGNGGLRQRIEARQKSFRENILQKQAALPIKIQ